MLDDIAMGMNRVSYPAIEVLRLGRRGSPPRVPVSGPQVCKQKLFDF